MSKFMLTAALVLGSLAGFSGTGRGGEASQPGATQTGRPAVPPQNDSQDFGPFNYLHEAVAARDDARKRGFAANVITKSDGYYIRVFRR